MKFNKQFEKDADHSSLHLGSKTHLYGNAVVLLVHMENFISGLKRVTGRKVAAAAKSLQLCPTLCDPLDGSPPGSPVPEILSPDKNTGVGCHFLLRRMKVKSESEVDQSSPTLSNLMDCSLPGSSVHGIFQARVLEWGAIAFSRQEG